MRYRAALTCVICILCIVLLLPNLTVAATNNLFQLQLAQQVYIIDNQRSVSISLYPTDTVCSATLRTELLDRKIYDDSDLTNCMPLLVSQYACLIGDYQQSLALMDQAFNTCPRLELNSIWLGKLKWSYGQKEEAVSEWLSVSTGGILLTNWGLMLSRQQAFFEAGQLLEPALSNMNEQLSPLQLAIAYDTLANVYRRQGLWEEAITASRQSVALVPTRWSSWFTLGGAYRQVGDWQLARESYTEAIRLLEDDQKAEQITVYEQLGLVERSAGNISSAQESFSKVYCLALAQEKQDQNKLKRLEHYLDQTYRNLGTLRQAIPCH
jgi:tetratricopeptide (TPR) repeat protein